MSLSFSGGNFCDKCNKGYRHIQSLSRHKRLECGKDPQFKCTITGCKFTSKHKPNLKQHMVCRHSIYPDKLNLYL